MAGRGTDIKLGGNKDFIGETNEVNFNDYKKNEIKVKDLGVFLLLVLKDMKVEELIIS